MSNGIVVTGAGGMLGKAVEEYCYEHNIDVWGYGHDKMNICDPHILEREIGLVTKPVAVINCAGNVHKGNTYTLDMVKTNALGPHVLAEHVKCPIIHVSTDCVFSGMYDAPYPVSWLPDPIDLYGRTKLVGEVKADHVLNVRTSFIGFDHGLMRWLLDQGQSYNVEGWSNAMWSGSTVWAVARSLVQMALNFKEGGIEHLATIDAISKYDLLCFLGKIFNLSIVIHNQMIPVIDRSLEPTVVLPSVFSEYEDLQRRYKQLKVASNG